MARIEAQSFKIDNDNLIRVRIYIPHISCSQISVQFKNDQVAIPIVSTSSGIIINNEVKVSNITEYIQVFIERSDSNHYECLISYTDSDLVHSESIEFNVDRLGIITPEPHEILSIRGEGNNWSTRMNQFNEIVCGRQRGSLWQIFLYCASDIIAKIRKKEHKKIFMAIGVESDLVLNSDYIFPVYPDKTEIIIPIEIFWKQHNKHNASQSQIACYELIKPDFLGMKNVFYKRKISNYVNIKDIPRTKKKTVNDYRKPTGQFLENEWYIAEDTNLPVYKDIT